MRTKNIFLALALMVAAVLLSAPVASAAPESPQSVLTYTAPYKIELYKDNFDCPIASHKFDKATGVGTVTFNGRLTTIGYRTFYGYRSLTSITIPDSVTAIGEDAFDGCTGELIVNCNIPNGSYYDYTYHGVFDGSKFTKVTIGEGVTKIGAGAFKGCSSLTSITIPNSVTTIGTEAFNGCSSLKSITIGNGVTSIGSYAFYGCNALKDVNINITDLAKYCTNNPIHNIPGNKHLYIENKEVTELVIPDGVTSIGYYAFYRCKSLKSITIPDSVTVIGEDAFDGCRCLTDVTTSERWMNYFAGLDNVDRINGKEIISDGSFKILGDKLVWVDKGASSVSIPATVKSIHPSAFEGCKNIENVNVANLNLWLRSGVDMSSCGSWQLYHNGKLVTNITIPDGVTKIGHYAFKGCSSLSSITIPASIEWIGKNAFEGCSSLTNITISNGVTKIGQQAFSGCSSLSSIAIPASVEWIGYYAFSDCSSLTNVTISNGVTKIGDGAFKYCSSLGSITIPASVEWIGESVVEGCDRLTNVTISNGVIWIGNYAFNGCRGLDSITIPASVKEIGESAFEDCSSLYSVTIGNGVTKIGNYAFKGCTNLGSITIPASVTYIGKDAFMRDQDWGTFYIYMKSITPPALGGRFENLYRDTWGEWGTTDDVDVIIYVPENALFNYRSADVWKEMANKIYPMN